MKGAKVMYRDSDDEIIIKTDSSGAFDDATRSKRILILGALLILGFVLPMLSLDIMTGDVVEFPNIERVFNASTPPLLKFMLLFPLVAGIIVIVVAIVESGIMRSLILIALGAVPFAIQALGNKTQITNSIITGPTSSISLSAEISFLVLLDCGSHHEVNRLA